MFGIIIDLFDVFNHVETRETNDKSRYAQCIKTITRKVESDFYRHQIIEKIPYGLSDDAYEAIMEIVDNISSDFYKCRNIETILRKTKK